ncbi:multiple ankyrin repeats single kh domain protein [Pyrenophora tritici-repentis]|nr:multiple ankyrin repeats single kh domain protein [Pyrenophora tritici-repentis]
MRLLYTASDKTLRWTKDIIRSEEIPPYAILSHTWGEQEVVFEDLKDIENAQSKERYWKIRFCAQQAERDGLKHFWVDTCCIDKANNTELSEAINSMFNWYQNADKCYVFLSDVEGKSSEENGKSSSRWKAAFRASRWFTRGWTLQELLAPRSVDFFSKDGARLGDKESLKQTIHEVTEIPIEALSAGNLSEFDIAERLSWAEKRQTTREEDKAYSHKQRQAETGLWLLESAKFTEWKESAASRLWLYGIPGCGKTILSSTIIEHLLQNCRDDTSMVTAYFYFDFNDTQKQDPELMLRSLLCQFLQRSVVIPKGVDALFLSCENGKRQPSLHALLQVTREAAQEFTHVYVVLDALDECTQRSELMDMLETIAEWQLDNLHLLMTSRKERDIESSLEEYIKDEDAVCLQRDVVDEDIQRYVQQRLRVDKGLAKWNKDASVRQEIEAALMHGARGMFRWAVCQLDTLEKCCNRAMLRKSLATLPRTLDQTYDRILTAISEEHSSYAIRILQWLTFSARPLSVEEIAEVVAIDVARDLAFDRDEVLEDPLEVLDICSSLVTITANEVDRRLGSAQRIVALAHYSVQEYLVSDRIRQGLAKQYSMQEAECHNTITRGSLKYLIQLQQPLSKETLKAFALAKYTAEFWSSHLQKTGDEIEQVSQLAMSLMAKEEPAYLNWIQLHDPDRNWGGPNLEGSLDSVSMPLYYAALLGLSTVTRLLLDAGADVNAQGGEYGNALQAALLEGDEQVVKTLLDKGADVNAQGGLYGNALLAASYGGHEQVVKTLLDKGAEVNAQGGLYGNALQAASAGGHEQVVKTLLDKGAEVNAQGGYFGNALQAASEGGYEYEASEGGHEQVVKTLLDKGADVNAQGGLFGNALQAASYGGHEQVVKTLLDKGAEVNAQGRQYGNALQAASAGGHEQAVKTLLDKGADVNAQGGLFGNALLAASARGHEQVVKMLLDTGAEVNAQGGEYGNALQAASYGGHEQVVKMLLDKGAEVNAQGGLYGNALQAALEEGHKQVVKTLLDKGADVNAQGGQYGNALQAASYGGHEQVVKTLLDKGAEVNAQDGRYGNALLAASARGHEQVVKMLLDTGAEVNAQGGEYGNALQAALEEGHKEAVKTLLDKSAEVNAQGGLYGNALLAASAGGHEQAVKTLLDAGADVNAQGGEYGNALQAASYGGHEQVVKTLLDKGAEVNAQGGLFGNALQAASYGGHEQAVKTLLDKGADVNAQGGLYGNALLAASEGGHEQAVKTLLNEGAEVNAQGGLYGNALQAASYGGHEQAVKTLLDKGADVNAQGGLYGNALLAASEGGHEQAVKTLLNEGAEVNAQGGLYGNALQAASYGGHEQAVKTLLDKGADVNAQGGLYGNALLAASYGGHEQVVKTLLDKGAEVNAQGGLYGNALLAASARGHEQVVKMLLEAGAHQHQENDLASMPE